MGRRRFPRLVVAFVVPVLAIVLSGCTLFGWTPPNGTRGDVTRQDAVLRAILVAEEHITEPMYDVLSCAGEDPCDGTDALVEAVDAETVALQAALDAHPDDCLAETARIDLQAYAELRKTTTERGDAFFVAAQRYNELKYDSFVATLGCPFLHGEGDPIDRAIRRASAAGWKGITDAYACSGDGCLEEHARTVGEDARAAVADASLHLPDVEPGCEKDYLESALSMLNGYVEIAGLLVEGDLEAADERTLDLDAEDNRTMRAFVECLDDTSSGGGWAPAPVSSANA